MALNDAGKALLAAFLVVAPAGAVAQDSQLPVQAASLTEEVDGQQTVALGTQVTLRPGPDFSHASALIAQAGLESAGCIAVVEGQGNAPGMLDAFIFQDGKRIYRVYPDEIEAIRQISPNC